MQRTITQQASAEPPRAPRGVGTLLAGIASALVLVALVFLMALYIRGLVWVAFAVCVFVLLPCALFRTTRKFSADGFFISSVIFGASTWILGFLATLQYWGAIGVFVGVIMGVVGIVPLGMLASAFHSDWSAIGMLALGLVLTFGARMAAFMVAKMMDRDEAGWVLTGVVAGVIAVGAYSGVVALSVSNGASKNKAQIEPPTIMFDNIVPCITVQYRDTPVCLNTFACKETLQSSFVREVCFDAAKSYMLIKLNDTWYHHCAVDRASVENLIKAPSVGTYYVQNFRSQGQVHGPFDCRDHPVPTYP